MLLLSLRRKRAKATEDVRKPTKNEEEVGGFTFDENMDMFDFGKSRSLHARSALCDKN